MGPRPRGRGIMAQFETLRDPQLELQWGRARAGAELMIVSGAMVRAILASMGPRPRGRGILMRKNSAGVFITASMGPRPRGRGIGFLGKASMIYIHASMGPRPRGRGIKIFELENCR